MTTDDLVAIAPLWVLAAAALLVLLAIAVRRSHRLAGLLAMAGLVGSGASLWPAAERAPRTVTVLFRMDGFALLFSGVVLAATLGVAVLAFCRRPAGRQGREELYVLFLLAALGALVLVASRHLAALFLGLETLSISLYVLIGYVRADPASAEAGLKYLVLAAASSAFLLMGAALIYAQAGTLEIPATARLLGDAGSLAVVGFGLLLAGVGFKLALVPFHMWAPDVFDGATAPVAAFVATVSKGAVVAVLLRYTLAMPEPQTGPLLPVLGTLAVVSMVAGNLLALRQERIKRLLAYSSVAHMGYVLVAVMVGGVPGAEAVAFYVVAYTVTTLGAFGVVSVLPAATEEAGAIEDYRGLFWRRPWLAAVLCATMLSLAGIPLTAGFVGKFTVLRAGVERALWLPAVVLVLTSVVGLFYYLRVVVTLFANPEGAAAGDAVAVPWSARVLLGVLLLLLLGLGVDPDPLVRLAAATATEIAP